MSDAEAISCPIRESMGILGRQWAMVVMRDLVMGENQRFSDFLRLSPGMSNRLLSRRLQELQEEGFVVRVERAAHHEYQATEKGRALLPVLVAIASFGSEHLPELVYSDGRARSLEEAGALSA